LKRVDTLPVAAKDSPATGAVGLSTKDVLAKAGVAGVTRLSPAAETATAAAEARKERARFMRPE
jgi:hypothetical protein